MCQDVPGREILTDVGLLADRPGCSGAAEETDRVDHGIGPLREFDGRADVRLAAERYAVGLMQQQQGRKAFILAGVHQQTERERQIDWREK